MLELGEWSLASGRGKGARLSVRFGGALCCQCRASTTVCTCLQREDFDTFNWKRCDCTFITRKCLNEQNLPEKLKPCVQV